MKVVPVTEFKAQCLALVERVASGKGSILISKHGRPVAELIPLREKTTKARAPLVGCVEIVNPDDDLLSTGVVWETAERRGVP